MFNWFILKKTFFPGLDARHAAVSHHLFDFNPLPAKPEEKKLLREEVEQALKMSDFIRLSTIFDFTQTILLYKVVNSLSQWEEGERGVASLL